MRPSELETGIVFFTDDPDLVTQGCSLSAAVSDVGH